MKCWKCGTDIADPFGKLSFRAACEACNAELHCCYNCSYYTPGKPNECAIPGTDYVSDREKMNFCEDFKQLGKGPSEKTNPNNAAKRLFGDDFSGEKENPKDRFNSLFDPD